MLLAIEHAMTNSHRGRAARNSHASEQELLARIRSREMAAFEELYRNYYVRVRRFLIKLIHRPTLIEEVLNDTFLVVWDRTDTFNGASKLSTWVFGIAYRKAMKALRRQDQPIEDQRAELRTTRGHPRRRTGS